jgi:hypothetical protein
MTKTTQEFLAFSTENTKKELLSALQALPEDKRGWSPASTARTALNMVAECAMNNGFTADLIVSRKWPNRDHQAYLSERDALAAGDWETLRALLEKNTEKLIAVIRAVPTEDLDIAVETPYGNGPLSGICAYPYWNMSYHLGQITYIATILGL